MQGSKLGNAFKWSTIKNTINYEQERDRQVIRETNALSEYTVNQLRAGSNLLKQIEQTRCAQRYGHLPDKTPIVGVCVYRSSFAAQVIRAASAQADRNTERAIDGLINATIKIPQVLSLATLLDSRNGGGDLGPSNQCPADDAVKKKPEKKREGVEVVMR